MPAIDRIVRVNSSTFSWNSSAFMFDGQEIEGITSLDWEEKREVAVAYGARHDGTPLAWGEGGKYSVPSFKIKMLKDSWSVLQAYLAVGGLIRPGLGSYGDSVFTFQAQCIEPIVGSIPITAVATPCRVIGKRETREEGANILLTELDVGCLNLVENGIPLWSVARSIL